MQMGFYLTNKIGEVKSKWRVRKRNDIQTSYYKNNFVNTGSWREKQSLLSESLDTTYRNLGGSFSGVGDISETFKYSRKL